MALRRNTAIMALDFDSHQGHGTSA